MKTIKDINKLIILVIKPVTLIRSKFKFVLLRDMVVEIKNIPAKGVINKSISNIT